MKMPAWSFSSLTSFETCGKRYYHLKVAKDVTETPHEATTWGSTVHTHLENRLKDGTPLPSSIAAYESLARPLAEAGGVKLIEQQFAIDSAMRPTAWMSEETWCRGIVDVGVLTGKRALLLDWKTGKRKVDSDQLKLFAALTFAHYPEIEVAVTGFLWLKTGQTDKQTFTKGQTQEIWMSFIPRVERMRRAYEEDKFHPKPSGLCSKWCPVPNSKCEFSGKRG